MPDPDRPNPLAEAASRVGVAWSTVSGVVSALVAYSVLTAAQGNAVAAAGDALPTTITALGTVIAGVMPIVAGLLSAFRTASVARNHVTPVRDPRDDQGNPLSPTVLS